MSALIRLNDLTFSYNKGKENQVDAIKHLSLEIERGDFVGIIGVSGSGKSTLLYLLAGLLKPDSGKCMPAANVFKMQLGNYGEKGTRGDGKAEYRRSLQ